MTNFKWKMKGKIWKIRNECGKNRGNFKEVIRRICSKYFRTVRLFFDVRNFIKINDKCIIK